MIRPARSRRMSRRGFAVLTRRSRDLKTIVRKPLEKRASKASCVRTIKGHTQTIDGAGLQRLGRPRLGRLTRRTR